VDPELADDPNYPEVARCVDEFQGMDTPTGRAAAEWLKAMSLDEFPENVTHLYVASRQPTEAARAGRHPTPLEGTQRPRPARQGDHPGVRARDQIDDERQSELAITEGKLAETRAAMDRYFRAFETGNNA
jgi:hypothetical protein